MQHLLTGARSRVTLEFILSMVCKAKEKGKDCLIKVEQHGWKRGQFVKAYKYLVLFNKPRAC